MKSHEIREKFLSYFATNDHQILPSSSLVPQDDPTLLFTNAGMNQFKNIFLGLDKPSSPRAVTSQKCVRAGGKHNDLENVGFTARHHTFFEMLGNFSFGDYFKKDAIHYAWHFVTKELGLPKDKLYVTVFKEDDESAEIWRKQEQVPVERIYRFGEKDNFWRMGEVGPCGPCSEIFYDLGPEVGGLPEDNVMGGPGDRFVEFWNLVFMEFFEDGQSRQKLPKPSIDTGMGLERLTTILQGELSNYHTDLFLDLMRVGEKISGVRYEKHLNSGLWTPGSAEYQQNEVNVALRVLSDHARASAFLLADGVMPSNEGRGYVLRRILRRAIRYGRKLTDRQSLLVPITEQVIAKMGTFYPELLQQQSLILRTIQDEEERFLTTLDQGTQILNDELRLLTKKREKILGGSVVFKLYDTYGFPVDLTTVIAREQGFEVDELGFEQMMSEARLKAKASWKGGLAETSQARITTWIQNLESSSGPTEFTGYDNLLMTDVTPLGFHSGENEVSVLKSGDRAMAVFPKTCFYAESGGQVGDRGELIAPNGVARVIDCKIISKSFVHEIEVLSGELRSGELCRLEVNQSERRSIANNHSATHLLHSALRHVLGDHVRQAGSLVTADRLRFDFTHSKPLSGDEVKKIENLVNRQIELGSPVQSSEMSFKEACDLGAMALFGEKYGDQVRVIQMGEFSTELCGGTHVENLSQIRMLKIVSESGLSAGVRRIEALSGGRAIEFLNRQMEELQQLKECLGLNESWDATFERVSRNSPVLNYIEKQRNEIKELSQQIKALKADQIDLRGLLNNRQSFDLKGQTVGFIFADLPIDDRKILSELLDQLKDRIQTGVIVLCGQGETESHPVLVGVTKNLTSVVTAGDLLKNITAILGGKGGGRPDFAQGAIVHKNKLSEAKSVITERLQAL